MPIRTCIVCGKEEQLIARIRAVKCRSCTSHKSRPWRRNAKKYTMIVHPQTFKRVYLHRYTMEEHLKRPLLDTEIVHHIDGDRHNNSLVNLELIVNQAEHMKEHRMTRNSDTGRFVKKEY